jgi:hypothetical protein
MFQIDRAWQRGLDSGVAGSFENGNELSCSINGREVFEYLSDYYLLNEECCRQSVYIVLCWIRTACNLTRGYQFSTLNIEALFSSSRLYPPNRPHGVKTPSIKM